jgi:hypothetical protein
MMEERMRVLTDKMVDLVNSDPKRLAALKADPAAELQKLANEASKYSPPNDPILYRIAISVLSLLALTTAAAALIFGLQDLKVPEVLVSLGSAAVGALVGLFAPSPVKNE